MIYYTLKEGGKVYWMPIKVQHSKIKRQLYKNRVKINGSYQTRVDIIANPVHSIFFCSNGRVRRIWDSSLNSYRPQKTIGDKRFPRWIYQSSIHIKNNPELSLYLFK